MQLVSTPAPPSIYAPDAVQAAGAARVSPTVWAGCTFSGCRRRGAPHRRSCNVRLHDHGPGCTRLHWTSTCNASLFSEHLSNAPSVAVIRDPCTRFPSQFDHLRAMLPACYANSTWESTLDWLHSITSACRYIDSRADSRLQFSCVQRAITANFHCADSNLHQLVWWPQAFFIPSHAMTPCYDEQDLAENLHFAPQSSGALCNETDFGRRIRFNDNEHVTSIEAAHGKRSLKNTPPAVVTERHCTKIRDAVDASLWDRACRSSPTSQAPYLSSHQTHHQRKTRHRIWEMPLLMHLLIRYYLRLHVLLWSLWPLTHHNRQYPTAE